MATRRYPAPMSVDRRFLKGEGGGAKLTHLHYQNFQYKKDKMSVWRYVKKGRSHQAWYDQEMYRGEGCVLRRGLTAPSVGAYDDRAQGRYDAQGHSLARDARSATKALTPIR